MIKQRINAALWFVLLTAFLAVQWAPAHAHLTGQHDHSGEPHQHSVEAHAHQSVIFHAELIDFAHAQLEEAQVIDLDHDALTSTCCQLDIPSAVATGLRPPPVVEAIAFVPLEDWNLPPDLLPPHIGQPRAPPPLA